MDIKEIAKRIRKTNNSYMLSMSPDIAAEFAEALIEYYKAELLKEVGEPVGYLHQWIEYHPYGDTVAGEPCSAITNDGKPFDKSDTVTLLFTSDQVAAALLKATKPLEEEVERLNQQSANRLIGLCKCGEDNDELRAQLSAAQEEIERYKASPTVETCRQMIESQAVKENKILFDQLAKAEQLWQVAQGRCDGLEEKLAKAEQRVAEACALQVATETRFHWLDAARVAKEIRSGEWHKFVKEV